MIVHQKSSPDPSNGLLLHQDFSVNSHNPGRLTSFLVLLGQVVIILAGLIGAGYTFLTSFSIPHYPLILLPSLFFCTFYWSFLLTRKSPFWILLGLGLPLFPAFFLLFPIREGFIVTVNSIVQALNQQMNWNLYDLSLIHISTPIPPIRQAIRMVAFFRLQWKLSIKNAETTSNKAIAEVAAAKNTKIKKINPNRLPTGIFSKTEGNVSKIKPGPAPGWKPNANTAGRIATPDKTAINVSNPAITPVSLGILVSLFK